MPGLAPGGGLRLPRRRRPLSVRGEVGRALGECTRRNTAFLLDRGAKLIVIACNSAAGAGVEPAREVAAALGVEVVAVIEPEAEIAAAITDSGRVGVLATPATVAVAPICASTAASTVS